MRKETLDLIAENQRLRQALEKQLESWREAWEGPVKPTTGAEKREPEQAIKAINDK